MNLGPVSRNNDQSAGISPAKTPPHSPSSVLLKMKTLFSSSEKVQKTASNINDANLMSGRDSPDLDIHDDPRVTSVSNLVLINNVDEARIDELTLDGLVQFLFNQAVSGEADPQMLNQVTNRTLELLEENSADFPQLLEAYQRVGAEPPLSLVNKIAESDGLSEVQKLSVIDATLNHKESGIKEIGNALKLLNSIALESGKDVSEISHRYLNAIYLYKEAILSAPQGEKLDLIRELNKTLAPIKKVFHNPRVADVLNDYNKSSADKIAALGKSGIHESYFSLNEIVVDELKAIEKYSNVLDGDGHEVVNEMKFFITAPPVSETERMQAVEGFKFYLGLNNKLPTELLQECEAKVKNPPLLDVMEIAVANLEDKETVAVDFSKDVTRRRFDFVSGDNTNSMFITNREKATKTFNENLSSASGGVALTTEREAEVQVQVTQATNAMALRYAYNRTVPKLLEDRWIHKALPDIPMVEVRPADLGLPNCIIKETEEEFTISIPTIMVTTNIGDKDPLQLRMIVTEMTVNRDVFVKEGFEKALIPDKTLYTTLSDPIKEYDASNGLTLVGPFLQASSEHKDSLFTQATDLFQHYAPNTPINPKTTTE